jgi:hypothetical protein
MNKYLDVAVGYVNVGRSYEASAIRLPLDEAKRTSYLPEFPRRQLLVMAVELYLKAYLLSKGLSEKEIRQKFSHKIGSMASYCRSLGLVISDERFELLELIQDAETFVRDRYFAAGVRTVPKDDALQDLAGALFLAVGEKVADECGKKFDGRGVSPINK